MHHSPFIRIAALSIVINSASNPILSSSPFSIDILPVLQQALPHFHTETNAKVRNGYLVVVKSLLAHVRRGLVPQFREQVSHAGRANVNTIVNLDEGQNGTVHVCRSQVLLEKNASFLKWFDDFLINELHPSASYQRHITALKAMFTIDLTSRFKNGAINVSGCNRADSEFDNTARDYFLGFQLIRLLLDLMMDPFEDVRSAAASLLRSLLSNIDSTNKLFNHKISMKLEANEDKSAIKISTPFRHMSKNIFVSTVDRAKIMISSTGRADHADGFGRLYQLKFCFDDVADTTDRISVLNHLLSSLSEDIRILQNNFGFAVGRSPLHGNLIALRYFALKSTAGLASANF